MPYVTTRTAPVTTGLWYEDLGSGRPVVLIHGWPLSHRMWEAQLFALLEAGHRVIAYDRRGFGGSGRPGSGYDYDTFAADLNDVIEGLDLHDVTLVGFSMGGGEVARYLGTYGESRVSQAVLAGAVTPYLLAGDDNPDGVPAKVFEGMLTGVREDRLAFLEGFFPGFYGKKGAKRAGGDLIAFSKAIAWMASPIATLECVRAFGFTDFRADLRKITVPLTVVHGDDDAIVPFAKSGKRVPEFAPHARVEVIDGAPHGFAATHARAFNALLLDVVAGTPPR
jgi:peroxiredoxin